MQYFIYLSGFLCMPIQCKNATYLGLTYQTCRPTDKDRRGNTMQYFIYLSGFLCMLIRCKTPLIIAAEGY